MFIELINWFVYLFIYINFLNPRYLYFKKKDTENIIKRIDKLTNNELEYVIKGCIIYDKVNHKKIISTEDIDIKDLCKNEIINIIGYSLFGTDVINLPLNKKYKTVLDIVEKIEIKLNYKFSSNISDKYMYRKWGSDFIEFNFRPFIIDTPIRLIINFIHIYFIFYLKFKYNVCSISNISYLYKLYDPNKKTILFIHGIGFGYISYIKILFELQTKYNIIIVILPNISSYRLYDNLIYMFFPSLLNIKESIYSFLNSNNIKECLLLSHSFGTYIAQILNKDKRNTVFKNIIMVDPIIFWIGCFKMSLYLNNPLVRKYPFTQYLLDNFLNFLVYQCIYLKYVCFRVMFGPDFWIYDSKELINSNIIFILEKNDDVIPAKLIYDKINKNANCIFIDNDDAMHGSIMTDEQFRPILINVIDNTLK